MTIAFNDESWSIDRSEKDNCLYIRTNDYHADPLKLTADRLREMRRLLEPAAEPKHQPVDVSEEKGQGSPFFGISRKEKCLYIGIPEGWDGLLTFSRKDLYRFGKKMGKRARP